MSDAAFDVRPAVSAAPAPVRASPSRRTRRGIALLLLGAALIGVPLIVFFHAHLAAMAIVQSLVQLGTALDLGFGGGWDGWVSPEVLGAVILTVSVAILALPGVVLFGLGLAQLRGLTCAVGSADAVVAERPETA